jgi:hypothetical protein
MITLVSVIAFGPSRANAPPNDHARSLRRNFGIGERDAMSAAGTNAAADADRQTAMGISRPGDGTVIFFSQFGTRPAAV